MSAIEARLAALERARRRNRLIVAAVTLALLAWFPVRWAADADEAHAGDIPTAGEPVSFFHTLRAQEVQIVDREHDLVFQLAPSPDAKGLAFLDARGTMLAQVGPVNGGGGVTVFNAEGRPVCLVTIDRQGGGMIQVADGAGVWRATLP